MPVRFEVRPEIVRAFTELTGDSSSIHTDVEFARRTRFRRPIAHGLLPVAVLLLRTIPELGNYWLRQLSCKFLGPTHIGETLEFSLSERQVVKGCTSYRFEVLKCADG